jgi:hypothetical protein
VLRNLSYERKFQLLILFSVLLGLVVYQFALSKTISLYKQNIQLNAKIKEASTAPAQFASLRKKLNSIDKVLQNQQNDSTQNTHDILLSTLSKYCKENNTTLKTFPETSFDKQGNFEIQTNTFTVQGNFTNLLQLVYLLEQKQRAGKISSVSFESFRDINTQKNILTASAYLQTIKDIK